MQYLSAAEAAAKAVGGRKIMECREGIILFPEAMKESGREELPVRLPEFYPATPAEAYYMTQSAGFYADTYGTPIMIRLPEHLRSMRAAVSFRSVRALDRRRREYMRERTSAAGRIPGRAFADSDWNRTDGAGTRGIIVRGPAWYQTMKLLNGTRGTRVLRIGTTWPVPEDRIREFLSAVGEVLVIDDTKEELLMPVYAVMGKYSILPRVRIFHGSEAEEKDVEEAVLSFAKIQKREELWHTPVRYISEKERHAF